MSEMALDPQIAGVYAELAEKIQAAGALALPARGDAIGLRAVVDGGLSVSPTPESSGVSVKSYQVTTSDQESIEVRWYTPDDADPAVPGAVVVYFHGGGMIAGKPEYYDGVARYYVEQSQVRVAVVDYRLAPEHPGGRMARDGLDTLRWMLDKAGELGVDPARIAVMGDSGGGGVAAATAILARDHDIDLARQILIYPMLDDRNTVPDPAFPAVLSWDWDANWTAWNALLGAEVGGTDVSPTAAPARLVEFGGLAPAYIEVGELDIFRDESINYAQRLHRVGISCELHILPGVNHGHDRLSVDIDVSRRTFADRCRVLAAL
ncbi:alpha/beta hydrolase [Nocardia salmonicida]|uniref:Alpha/beta hydrolase n=1 Tax=Nocardia salmonicida TaxID=53431 RepID=A0ABZ1N321_9NOCA